MQADCVPGVTVIVPNYNHARFLDQRMRSILEQTHANFEVICLDDASSDDSIKVFERYAADPRVRTIFNDVNSGVPGKQWNKGLQHARFDLIWIAESDDYADPRFLEILTKRLKENPEVGLAYSQSRVVDVDGTELGLSDRHTFHLAKERWRSDFVNRGAAECVDYLIHTNTVPNASAVVFRKEVYEKAGYADESMRFCGDWLLWLNMLMRSDVLYVSEPLNYYRRHSSAFSTVDSFENAKAAVEVQNRAKAAYPVLLDKFERNCRLLRGYTLFRAGRSALLEGRRLEGRHYLFESLKVYPLFLGAVYWMATFFGARMYKPVVDVTERSEFLKAILEATGKIRQRLKLRIEDVNALVQVPEP